MLLHLKRIRLSNNDEPADDELALVDYQITHDQIGIGTGEDIVPFCYFWERIYNGFDKLSEIKSFRDSEKDNMVTTEDQDHNSLDAQWYLHGWDFDAASLTVCKENLAFASAKCVISEANLYTQTEMCLSITAATTAASGELFFVQALLYTISGGKTKYFIFDNESNRKALFSVIDKIADLLKAGHQRHRLIMKSAKTSHNSTKSPELAMDAFHGPFMRSAIAAVDIDAEDDHSGELTERDLSYLVIDQFIDWTYKYLPSPSIRNVNQPITQEAFDAASNEEKREHCMVSYLFNTTTA